MTPGIYRLAAELLDEGSNGYACMALAKAQEIELRPNGEAIASYVPGITEFRELFDGKQFADAWLSYFDDNGVMVGSWSEGGKQVRVLALLLMAEICDE